MRSGLVVVIALGVLAVAAPASAATVVSGTVVLFPALPVCRVGHPCTKPLAHFKLVFWRLGRVAADPLKSNEMAPASTHNDCKEVR